jgi:hypothetical protein
MPESIIFITKIKMMASFGVIVGSDINSGIEKTITRKCSIAAPLRIFSSSIHRISLSFS